MLLQKGALQWGRDLSAAERARPNSFTDSALYKVIRERGRFGGGALSVRIDRVGEWRKNGVLGIDVFFGCMPMLQDVGDSLQVEVE